MTYGILSDIHLSSKPYRLRSALRLLSDCEAVLIAGDIADLGRREQYELALRVLSEELSGVPVFLCPGNHDIREGLYPDFERQVLRRFSARYTIERSATGAYYTVLDEETDLLSPAPQYHQDLFRFPEKGEQLAFAEERLGRSTARRHLVLCHPPLHAQYPLDAELRGYLPKAQETQLRQLIERIGDIVLISGHTHHVPAIERDAAHRVLYLNAGSIAPTVAGPNGETQPGNVLLYEPPDTLQCRLLVPNRQRT